MKIICKSLRFFVLIITAISITNCNQVRLSETEAKDLIVKELTLPLKINRNSGEYIGYVNDLAKGGYLSLTPSVGLMPYAEVTEKGKPYLVSIENGNWGLKKYVFHCFDVDFNAVEGISVNKEQQTAIVRFSLKPINVTPVGKIIYKNIKEINNFELVFKKFDSGWQIASDQEYSIRAIIRECEKK
jgi:hypothetical protein